MIDRARAPIRILVADDEADVRDAYRQIFLGDATDGDIGRLRDLQARLFHAPRGSAQAPAVAAPPAPPAFDVVF